MKLSVTSIALALAATSPAFAQTTTSYTLSAPLVEEIYQKLAAQPYSGVAATVAKMQAELQHQPVAAPLAPPPAPTPQPAPPLPAQEPKK
jgi:hypothetical protein